MLMKVGEEQIMELWTIFRRMVDTARAYHPELRRINEFKTDAARFFILHRLRLTDDSFAYYIHTVCFHGRRPDAFCLLVLSLLVCMSACENVHYGFHFFDVV